MSQSSNSTLIIFPDGVTYRRSGECNGCKGEARCCTYMRLPLARSLTADEVKWAELHPHIRIEGKTVVIDIACSALDGVGRCALFGSPDRPAMCVNYPEEPGLDPGCSFTFERIE